MDQKREKVYIGIIIALLIFTYYSQSMQSRNAQQIENSIQSMRMSMSGEIGLITQQVNRIQEEERWWSKGSMEFEMIEEDLQRVTTEWEVRDYKDGEAVYFHYLPPGEEDYQILEMEEVQIGLFRSEFDLEMTIEPEIRIHYSGRPGDHRNEVAQFMSMDEEGPGFFHYYLSTEYNGERRTTGKEQLHFSGVKYNLYPPVHVDLHYGGSNQSGYSLNIDLDHYHMPSEHQLERVEVFLMKQGQQVREVEMEYREERPLHFYHKDIPVEDEEFDEILMRFTYANEERFERSIKVGGE